MRKAYAHKMNTNTIYNILIKNAVTIALIYLLFYNTTMEITFKKLHNAIQVEHLKSHF